MTQIPPTKKQAEDVRPTGNESVQGEPNDKWEHVQKTSRSAYGNHYPESTQNRQRPMEQHQGNPGQHYQERQVRIHRFFSHRRKNRHST